VNLYGQQEQPRHIVRPVDQDPADCVVKITISLGLPVVGSHSGPRLDRSHAALVFVPSGCHRANEGV
jgi:hypothetical protein